MLIDLVGLRRGIEVSGASVQRDVRNHLRELLDARLRRTDLYGELGTGELLVAMPGVEQQVALSRVESIAEAFRERCGRDETLGAITFALGASDTLPGICGVTGRAEQDLRMGGSGHTMM